MHRIIEEADARLLMLLIFLDPCCAIARSQMMNTSNLVYKSRICTRTILDHNTSSFSSGLNSISDFISVFRWALQLLARAIMHRMDDNMIRKQEYAIIFILPSLIPFGANDAWRDFIFVANLIIIANLLTATWLNFNTFG